MCEFNSASQSFQPAWATDYNFSAYSQHRASSTISPKTSIYGPAGGRRGAIVAGVEDHETQLEQIRRGSISTIFNTMSFQEKPLQLPLPPMKPSATYIESILSPPSSPRSPQSPLHRHAELPVTKEEEVYDDRRFQRQIMSRLQALNHFQEEEEAKFSEESKFTPPPSPRPFMQLELPTRQSDKSGSGSGCKRRARSLKSVNNNLAVASPLPSPSSSTSRSTKGGRRVSAPGAVTSTTSSSHKSSRGAVKKATSSASSSRRGSSKGLEVLLEGTLFKSGWSWASAYENGNNAVTEDAGL